MGSSRAGKLWDRKLRGQVPAWQQGHHGTCLEQQSPVPGWLSPKTTQELDLLPLLDLSEIRQQVPAPQPPLFLLDGFSWEAPLPAVPSPNSILGVKEAPHEACLCHYVPNPFPLAPVFTYSAAGKETCAQHHGRCSPHAFCTDYTTGICCHCRATYYGNGRQCLPEGMRGGWRGRGPPAWVAAARGAHLPAQGPCIASTGR